MVQLESTKCSFLFCLGLCVLICSAIYLKARFTSDPVPQQSQAGPSPSPRPRGCDVLPGFGEGTKSWRGADNLTEAYITAPDFNCSRAASDLHFITSALSREEEGAIRPSERLLRPRGRQSPPEYKGAVARLAGCFPNVFLASASERVTYAGFSRLKADINCMRDLARSPVPWKKVINLCGQDFPIKTNLELVRYMQSAKWRDRNMTPGIKQPPTMSHRTQRQHTEVKGLHVAPRGQAFKKGPPPHKLQIYFGTAYYSLTRAFVNFVLRSKVARDLLQWSRDTYSPDEHYWVTLNHLQVARHKSASTEVPILTVATFARATGRGMTGLPGSKAPVAGGQPRPDGGSWPVRDRGAKGGGFARKAASVRLISPGLC
ncbi:hypothetical protein AAFF_G00385390 [Aldrovandia affinis]|uniref:Uncharacterized protein n=1 Tax=Aldrovandia affinis TaxID=143900 RepID=A0AAD7WLM8_9TELE|nr:hypothetical protein AAFF_G00385390 [Aldrovandia affinis]